MVGHHTINIPSEGDKRKEVIQEVRYVYLVAKDCCSFHPGYKGEHSHRKLHSLLRLLIAMAAQKNGQPSIKYREVDDMVRTEIAS